METVDKLKEKLLYKRIKGMTGDKLILEDGTEVSFECTEYDCCASAGGEWISGDIDAVITDVKMQDIHKESFWDYSHEVTATIAIYHNQNIIAQADINANDGNGGYYYSVLSVIVNEENVGVILSC